MTTFIYALIDPTSREIRYIGKADNPKKRLRSHLTSAKHEKNHKANWIRSLLTKRLRPILELIDEVLQSEWQAAEAAYIAFYKEEGYVLVNNAPGGDGLGSGKDNPRFGKPGKPVSEEQRLTLRLANLGKKHSAETRAKMSAQRKGKTPSLGIKHSAETRAKMSAARKGQKRSPEQCARLSDALRGRTFSAEHRSKISAARKGKIGMKASLEHRAKISAANRRRKLSPETRAKISTAHKGKKLSAEHCAKMSAANKGEKSAWFGRKHTTEARAKMSAARTKLRDRRWVETCLKEMWN